MQLISKEDLDEVQHWMIEKRFSSFSWGRVIVAPAILVFLLAMLARGGGTWRLWVLGGAAVLIAWRAYMMRRCRGDRDSHQKHEREKQWMPIVIGVVLLVTGGLDSPMLPMMALFVFLAGTLAPPHILVRFAGLAMAVIVFLGLASALGFIPHLMPTIFGGGSTSPQPTALVYWKMGAFLFAIYWGAFVASNVRHVFRQIAVDAIDARDEILRGHDAHTRELTTLTGELAHELKNPLANMKGLAVLISRDVHGGKAAERLGVLQGEIDRLNGIVQGFLTFSRPLIPLSQEEVELGELCDGVVALHEGLAHFEDVAIIARPSGEPGGVHASCDPRKVKQILINLVQNALEASPAGAAVEIVPIATDTGARVEVRDRGPGIDKSMRQHLFEPGMTTKERGSGLGLALARALARQHGGDVSLEDREGGGSVAILTLPREPGCPAACAGEAA